MNQEAGIQSATAGFVFIYPNRKFQKLVQHSSYVEHHDHGSVWQVPGRLLAMFPSQTANLGTRTVAQTGAGRHTGQRPQKGDHDRFVRVCRVRVWQVLIANTTASRLLINKYRDLDGYFDKTGPDLDADVKYQRPDATLDSRGGDGEL